MKRTNRGFGIYTQFQDSRNADVRIQRSSEMGKRYVWLFAEGGQATGPHVSGAAAVYLDVRQARRVAKALLAFAEGDE